MTGTFSPMNITFVSEFFLIIPCAVKLNNGGNSRWFGSVFPGSRSSSKNWCAQASNGEIRLHGVYSNSNPTKSIASDGVLGRNTWNINLVQKYHSPKYV